MPEYVNYKLFVNICYSLGSSYNGCQSADSISALAIVPEASATLLGILIKFSRTWASFSSDFVICYQKGLFFPTVLQLIHKCVQKSEGSQCSIGILTKLKHLANARPSHPGSPDAMLMPSLQVAAVLTSNSNNRVLNFKQNHTVCIFSLIEG